MTEQEPTSLGPATGPRRAGPYRHASITLTRTATSAGRSPASAPIPTAASMPVTAAENGNPGASWTADPMSTSSGTLCRTTIATVTPSSPATVVATTLSIITEKNTRPELAPKLRRIPISRIRYRTVTSAMFTSPSPPSSSAIALTPSTTHRMAPSTTDADGESDR